MLLDYEIFSPPFFLVFFEFFEKKIDLVDFGQLFFRMFFILMLLFFFFLVEPKNRRNCCIITGLSLV